MFTTNSNTGPLPEYANIQTARGIKVLDQVPRNLFHRAVVYLFNTQVNCVFLLVGLHQVSAYTVKG